MALNQGFDIRPMQTTNTRRQSGNGETGDLSFFRFLLQSPQAMIHIPGGPPTRLGSWSELTILGQKAKNSHPKATPEPDFTWLGMSLTGKVAKVLGHGWPLFPQG